MGAVCGSVGLVGAGLGLGGLVVVFGGLGAGLPGAFFVVLLDGGRVVFFVDGLGL